MDNKEQGLRIVLGHFGTTSFFFALALVNSAMVQFTYVPLTLCKLFPTLKRNPEFISSCRNVHIDHMSISSRGIFNWVKIEGEKEL